MIEREPAPDVIEIRGIRAYGKHGADVGERDADQPFALDVTLHVDLGAPGRSDALGDTVDYARVTARIRSLVRTTSYRLLERLADEISRDLLSDERVAAATVRIAKPHLLDGATPAVQLFRTRPRAGAGR